MLHLDLLVLVGGFGVSHFFFNKGEIGTSVPLVYPVLAYFLVRMLVAAFRPRRIGRAAGPVRARRLPGRGDRPARRLPDRTRPHERQGGRRRLRRARSAPTGSSTDEPLYVDSGEDDLHFDTYGPVNYLAYDPFVKRAGAHRAADPGARRLRPAGRPRGRDRVRPAHPARAVPARPAAASRPRGRMLGLALAYGWVSFPYTLFPLMSNSNDTLIAMLVVFALLALTSTPGTRRADRARGRGEVRPARARAAVRDRPRRRARRLRSWIWFCMAFAVVGAGRRACPSSRRTAD